MKDEMECGCFWTRHPDYGDVLVECPRHAAGEPHAGSKPDPEDAMVLIDLFKAAGLDVVTPNTTKVQVERTGPDTFDLRVVQGDTVLEEHKDLTTDLDHPDVPSWLGYGEDE